MTNSGWVKVHQPCPCGKGSDNTGVNGNGSAKCFTCGDSFKNYEQACKDSGVEDIQEEKKQPRQVLSLAKFQAMPDRKLSLETCKFYGVTVVENTKGISQHNYPYHDEAGDECSIKTRYCDSKDFQIRGDHKKSTLFGQHLFKAGSAKYITVTEGELDAMSVFQMTGSKWPSVSVKNGSSGALNDFKKAIPYLESFDNVVLCFDQDEAGQKAVDQVAKLLTPGKVMIMSLPRKDANEMLIANRSSEFVQCFWNAEKYIPSGIINVSDYMDKFFDKYSEKVECIPYPWKGLNDKLDGMIQKSLISITGGTGLGKSSLTRILEDHLLANTDKNVGVMALEEDTEQTILGLMSIGAQAQLFRQKVASEYPDEEIKEFFTKTFKGDRADRLFVHSHLGIQDIEDIFAKLRFLALGCDCNVIVLDHLHMLVHAHSTVDNDERRTIDEIMLRLRSLVEETGCTMILVSHLRRTQNDRGHEQGIEVSLSHLRGSQSIAQLSDVVIALERNQQSDNQETANTSVLRILKSRHTGDTGVGCYLKYDRVTGLMHEVEAPVDLEFSYE